VAVVGRPRPLDLDLAWRAHVRRFDLEHTVRFAKQTLGWTTPAAAPPAQAERWTWPVVAGYAQLRLARQLVADQRLAWSGPAHPVSCRPTGSAEGFRACRARWARRPARRNPPGAPPAGPRATDLALRHPAVKKPATKPTKKARKKPTRVAKAA
jgi:hypothetical protein